jgi:hypothetical protein
MPLDRKTSILSNGVDGAKQLGGVWSWRKSGHVSPGLPEFKTAQSSVRDLITRLELNQLNQALATFFAAAAP